MTIKEFFSNWWADIKIFFQEAKARQNARELAEMSIMNEDRDDEYDQYDDFKDYGVNPSTGMPMISDGVDCMGTPFGLSDSSRYH